VYWLLPVLLLFSTMIGAVSTQPKNFQKGTLTLIDGTGTPVTLVVQLTEGDFKCSELMQYLNAPTIYSARTIFVGLGSGAPSYPKWSISAKVGNIVGSATSGTGTALEFATGKGAYSANVSTIGASRRMVVDAKLTIEGTDWGDSADETFTMEDSLISIDFSEGEQNKITISGQCLGNVVIVNNTNTVTLAQAA
jgi:hypothetical protein